MKSRLFSGGRLITRWKSQTIDNKKLWAADLAQVRSGKCFFRQMWVNRQRRIRARYPKKGYLQVAETPDVTPATQWNQGQTRFKYREGNLENWSSIEQVERMAGKRNG